MDKLPEDVTSRITNMVKSMGDGVTNILSNSLQYITSLISTIFLLIMVPFFLIYMLKTMKNLSQLLLNFSKVSVKSFCRFINWLKLYIKILHSRSSNCKCHLRYILIYRLFNYRLTIYSVISSICWCRKFNSIFRFMVIFCACGYTWYYW